AALSGRRRGRRDGAAGGAGAAGAAAAPGERACEDRGAAGREEPARGPRRGGERADRVPGGDARPGSGYGGGPGDRFDQEDRDPRDAGGADRDGRGRGGGAVGDDRGAGRGEDAEGDRGGGGETEGHGRVAGAVAATGQDNDSVT